MKKNSRATQLSKSLSHQLMRLMKERQCRGGTIHAISKEIGIYPMQVYRILKDKNMRIGDADILAKALGYCLKIKLEKE